MEKNKENKEQNIIWHSQRRWVVVKVENTSIIVIPTAGATDTVLAE